MYYFIIMIFTLQIFVKKNDNRMNNYNFLLVILLVLMALLTFATCSKTRHHNIGSTKKMRECWTRCQTLYILCQQKDDMTVEAFLLCKMARTRCNNNCKIKKKLKIKSVSSVRLFLRKKMRKLWGNSFVQKTLFGFVVRG